MNKQLSAMLKRHEGRYMRSGQHMAYRCPANKLTIGFGRNLDANGISEDEANLMLSNDINKAATALYKSYPWFATLDVVRRAALIDMAFNMGMRTLGKFRNMMAAMQAGDYAAAAAHAKDSAWYTQVKDRAVEVVAMIRTGEWQ